MQRWQEENGENKGALLGWVRCSQGIGEETMDTCATNVYVDAERLHVRLSDGREISAPLRWFPRLQHATDEQRQQWELIGQGRCIQWEAIDEDISVAGLLGLPHD